MELQDYIRILRRRGWIIILLTVMTAAAAFAFSKLQTAVYESSVSILVQPARSDLGLTQSTQWLLRSYVSWMNTDTRAQEVIDLLSLDRMPGDLRSDVKIASDESRFVIQLTVENPDGDVANDIAQAWTDLFVQWRNAENEKQRKEDRVEAIQLDPPRYALARPKWKINVLAGTILGALVGGAVVFVLEWIESGVVRRPEDIQRYLELPLLGAIPAPKLELGRPYLLGGRSTSAAHGAVAMPPVRPVVSRPEPPRVLPSPEAAQSAPPAPVEDPQTGDSLAPSAPEVGAPPTPSVQAEAPPATTPDDEEAGPIEPTILLSKGDEL
jgi:capsular polysaccharide biosynthesis protein